MEQKRIVDINPKYINKQNYKAKIDEAWDFLEEMRRDCDAHINFCMYNFIAQPSLYTLNELGANLRLKSLLNNEIAETFSTAYRKGRLDWDDEHYAKCYAGDLVQQEEKSSEPQFYTWGQVLGVEDNG